MIRQKTYTDEGLIASKEGCVLVDVTAEELGGIHHMLIRNDGG